MSLSEEAAALSVCSAAVAAANAGALAIEKKVKSQILTVNRLDFERILNSSAGDAWFRKNVRCSRTTFLTFVGILQDRKFEFSSMLPRSHSYAKRVAAVLYFFASSGSYRASASAMGMNESVLFEAVDELTYFLVELLPEVVRFPDSLEEWRQVEAEFKQKQGIPGVTGAVDGSLIAIQRPDDFEGFYCRKCYTAINMQAIVDSNLKFMAIDMFPGSWSDKKMWTYAPSSTQCCAQMPVETHLLGDSGYTLLPWLITPYLEREEDGQLSPQQKRFNFKHSSTRMAVERAFRKLKGRFRRLLTVMSEKTVEKACNVIAATVVIHNMFETLSDDTAIEVFREPKETVIADPDLCCPQQLRSIAKAKRNTIMSLVAG